jgi:hypothetical protein
MPVMFEKPARFAQGTSGCMGLPPKDPSLLLVEHAFPSRGRSVQDAGRFSPSLLRPGRRERTCTNLKRRGTTLEWMRPGWLTSTGLGRGPPTSPGMGLPRRGLAGVSRPPRTLKNLAGGPSTSADLRKSWTGPSRRHPIFARVVSPQRGPVAQSAGGHGGGELPDVGVAAPGGARHAVGGGGGVGLGADLATLSDTAGRTLRSLRSGRTSGLDAAVVDAVEAGVPAFRHSGRMRSATKASARASLGPWACPVRVRA